VSADLLKMVAFLNHKMDVASFEDDSLNGLQIEGPHQISKVGLAVDACLRSIAAAIDNNCDLLVVHHGLFWGSGLRSVTGTAYRRLAMLVQNNIALYACHLPLDAHATLGNNTRLAELLQLKKVKPFARYHGRDIGVAGELPAPAAASDVALGLAGELGRSAGISCNAGVVGDSTAVIKRVGVVSGGGTLALQEAARAGLDALVTGEGPHHANLDAMDSGVVLIYAGHYETETLGVRSLGAIIEKKFKVPAQFLNVAH
jgi:dinuclear metal center YbgI/SA1388 family protein